MRWMDVNRLVSQAQILDTLSASIADVLSSCEVLVTVKSQANSIDILASDREVWVVLRTKSKAVLAYRVFHSVTPVGVNATEEASEATIKISTDVGQYVSKTAVDGDILRIQLWATFNRPLHLEASDPEMLFLGESKDAASARGDIWFSQKKCSTGFVYGQTHGPIPLSFLYFQNFTSLNDYFELTGARPSDVVKAAWPSVGFARPRGKDPLPARRKVQLLDSTVCLGRAAEDPFAQAERFLELLSRVYQGLEKPETKQFNWLDLAEEVHEMLEDNECSFTMIEGNRYLLPYVNGGRPDSLTQFRTLAWLAQYECWRQKPSDLRDDLAKTIVNFYNKDDGYIVRFPCFGNNDCGQTEKIDTWYSVYALLNLAEIAKAGDVGAHIHLTKAVDYIEKMAKKFKYDFPVFYDAQSFKVIQQGRGEDAEGQTDVAGLYSWILQNVTDLTGDPKHREGAIEAIKSTKSFSFNLCYQTNITAWGAAAAFRFWDEEKDDEYFKIGLVYLANFFRYCIFFEPSYGFNKEFDSFMSVMALSSSEYTAVLENADSCAAIQDIVRRCDKRLPDWLSMLCNEYCKFSLNHCKFYFPKLLAESATETKPKEGKIDRSLPVPVEDLYLCGEQKGGKVGQEVYGSGSAFAMCAIAFRQLRINGGFASCEYPYDLREEKGFFELDVYGREEYECAFNLWRLPSKVDRIKVVTSDKTRQIAVRNRCASFKVSGGSSVRIVL